MMRHTSDFAFSEISPEVRMTLVKKFGQFPDAAHVEGNGRFEISIQNDI
jgi:hypothetical protein